MWFRGREEVGEVVMWIWRLVAGGRWWRGMMLCGISWVPAGMK